MTDVLDEYIMGHLTEFEDAKFVNIAKEDLELTSAEGEVRRSMHAQPACQASQPATGQPPARSSMHAPHFHCIHACPAG